MAKINIYIYFKLKEFFLNSCSEQDLIRIFCPYEILWVLCNLEILVLCLSKCFYKHNMYLHCIDIAPMNASLLMLLSVLIGPGYFHVTQHNCCSLGSSGRVRECNDTETTTGTSPARCRIAGSRQGTKRDGLVTPQTAAVLGPGPTEDTLPGAHV